MRCVLHADVVHMPCGFYSDVDSMQWIDHPSNAFDSSVKIKYHVDPNTNKIDNFLPFRSFPDAPSQEYMEKIYFSRKERDEKMVKAVMERVRKQKFDARHKGSVIIPDAKPEFRKKLPWWKDEQYVIGLLTRKSRIIRIRNTLIMKTVDLEVCSEETIEDILQRYLKFNSHAKSYAWKYHGQELDMGQNLEMNGIPDKDFQLNRLRQKEEDFIPTLNLYYKDDLTEL
ncbi:Cytochrome b5 domain-containing protein 1, partial [Stegodyphus mimosarum]